MSKWWPFRKSEQTPQNTYREEEQAFHKHETELRQYMAQQIEAGVSRQALLKKMEAQAIELEQVQNTADDKGRLRAYDLVYGELRDALMRNLQSGRVLEMNGRIAEAIDYYETAVADQMSTRFPYEHLRIIYRRQEQYADALRICETAVANPFLEDKDHQHFQSWVDKFKQHLQTS
ncbi:MAG: hypothetical protein KC443_09370 [Anaerolineales bacterium]|nr:hypothetical protein [Anaerolineales bacterium]MCB8967864.1 hypothetical protein [Ardenticatenaceae bacterium]